MFSSGFFTNEPEDRTDGGKTAAGHHDGRSDIDVVVVRRDMFEIRSALKTLEDRVDYLQVHCCGEDEVVTHTIRDKVLELESEMKALTMRQIHEVEKMHKFSANLAQRVSDNERMRDAVFPRFAEMTRRLAHIDNVIAEQTNSLNACVAENESKLLVALQNEERERTLAMGGIEDQCRTLRAALNKVLAGPHPASDMATPRAPQMYELMERLSKAESAIAQLNGTFIQQICDTDSRLSHALSRETEERSAICRDLEDQFAKLRVAVKEASLSQPESNGGSFWPWDFDTEASAAPTLVEISRRLKHLEVQLGEQSLTLSRHSNEDAMRLSQALANEAAEREILQEQCKVLRQAFNSRNQSIDFDDHFSLSPKVADITRQIRQCEALVAEQAASLKSRLQESTSKLSSALALEAEERSALRAEFHEHKSAFSTADYSSDIDSSKFDEQLSLSPKVAQFDRRICQMEGMITAQVDAIAQNFLENEKKLSQAIHSELKDRTSAIKVLQAQWDRFQLAREAERSERQQEEEDAASRTIQVLDEHASSSVTVGAIVDRIGQLENQIHEHSNSFNEVKYSELKFALQLERESQERATQVKNVERKCSEFQDATSETVQQAIATLNEHRRILVWKSDGHGRDICSEAVLEEVEFQGSSEPHRVRSPAGRGQSPTGGVGAITRIPARSSSPVSTFRTPRKLAAGYKMQNALATNGPASISAPPGSSRMLDSRPLVKQGSAGPPCSVAPARARVLSSHRMSARSTPTSSSTPLASPGIVH